MFELSQLRCFVVTAEELHFGRAAVRLNMTQPPLSRQIQLLEHVLGVKLLDRTSRAVKLTPAGRVFLLEARRILRLTESAALATRRIASGEAGTITLGFTAASGYSFLPRLLLQRAARVERRGPEIEVHLAQALARRGDREEARGLLRQLLVDPTALPEREQADAQALLHELGG